jgi:hypothetical protein
METFFNYQSSELDRIRWYNEGNRVLCNNCGWIGPDEEHDHCPVCNSDRLEWILEKEGESDYIEAMLQSIKPVVSN